MYMHFISKKWCRGFESPSLRHFGFSQISRGRAVEAAESAWNPANRFHGFLNATASDLSATCKFEPIFFEEIAFVFQISFGEQRSIVPWFAVFLSAFRVLF